MLLLLILFVILLIKYFVYYTLTKNHNYWKSRNVPYLEPKLLFGNYREFILQKKYGPGVASEICKQFPNEPYIGTFFGTEPALLVQDPDIIKLVLVKDFTHFSGKEATHYSYKETITRSITMNGGDEWKVQRTNLNPLFTSSKLKSMFPLINNSVQELELFLKTETKLAVAANVNVRSLLARYTMDCIVSCCFGINANAMNSYGSENTFMVMGESIFDTSIVRGFKMVCRSMWPGLFYALGLRLFDEHISAYFHKIFDEVTGYRRKNGFVRNDFVDHLMEWKMKRYLTCDSISNYKTKENNTFKLAVNDDLLVGVSLSLFGAGFETTATTMAFILYELSKNQQIQDKVIEEVDSYFERNNGVIDYECVNTMPYLEACLNETLRLYPIIGILTREVMDEYTLPSGLQLNVGDRIHIPVYHIQRNPNIYHDPEIFDPGSFLDDNRKKVKPFTFLPFGEGPRICIGLRFAKMLITAGFLTIFKNYRVALADNTPMQMQFKSSSFTIQSVEDIYLDFLPR